MSSLDDSSLDDMPKKKKRPQQPNKNIPKNVNKHMLFTRRLTSHGSTLKILTQQRLIYCAGFNIGLSLCSYNQYVSNPSLYAINKQYTPNTPKIIFKIPFMIISLKLNIIVWLKH